MTIVIPCFKFKSNIIFMTMSVFLVSFCIKLKFYIFFFLKFFFFKMPRSPVGSSKRRILGLLASARAMVTLCYSPPDN